MKWSILDMPAHDGRLKTLNFVISSREHLDTILTCGERVDGSSLFKHIEAGSSDLYVIQDIKQLLLIRLLRFQLSTFSVLFIIKMENPLIVLLNIFFVKLTKLSKMRLGYSFEVMGELEYYVISKKQELFHADDQRGSP